ncbi:MAG: baseplate J/gp47 family protein [Actinomycetia bacterium]|nr:baseplate J/gp47 family protein [Actinomycetes bacterium]
MPLETPDSPSDIERDLKTDFQRELVSSNPFLPNSWISALISGFSNRLFDNYLGLEEAVKVSFYDTSPEIYLERQASWYNVFRLAATQATGNIIFTGTDGVVVPSGTEFASSGGITAITDSDATITTKSDTPTSVSSSGTTATVVMPTEHELSPGVEVTISGANESEYNGTFDVNIVDEFSFTYDLDSSTTTPATGTILVDYVSGIAPCTTTDFSSEANLEADSLVILSGAITNVDSTAYVDSFGFGGGTDKEGLNTFRTRFLDRVGNPVANFNDAAIDEKARQISGVTRVWIQDVTPSIGQVTIYFTRDNDNTIIPSSEEATTVKNSILEIKPANTADEDVIVDPLVGVSTNFTFTSIVPNTTTMSEAVENSLREFFRTIPNPEENVLRDQYITAIYNTVDLETGDRIESFDLLSPIGDISVSTGEIAILGTVSI